MNFPKRKLDLESSNNAVTDILGPNALTGAGVIYAGAPCVASTMLLATVMPAQVIGSATIAGGLYTAGQLKQAGKLPDFGFGSKDEPTETAAPDLQVAA